MGDAALPFLLTSERIEAAQRWKLVDLLYNQNRTLCLGSSAIWIVAALCWLRTGSAFWPGWAFCAAVLMVARLWLANRYRNRVGGSGDPDRWAGRFAIGAGGSAALLSLAVFLSLTRVHDTHVQLYVMTLMLAYLGGASSRNAASPAVVTCQLIITLPPMIAACLLSNDSAYYAYAVLPLMAMLGFREIAQFQGRVLLEALAAQSEEAAANRKLNEACSSLVHANTQLERLSSTDALTGIANRRAFDTALEKEWSRAIRERSSLSLLMFDVDHFKAYNDQLGHPAGDVCLKRIAETLNDGLLRPMDLIARIGGEEFAALLPATDIAGACKAGERLMASVAACEMAHERSGPGIVTVSVGAASLHPRQGDEAADLLLAADTALYKAKLDGRNCLRAYDMAMT